jgi:hypothetical protein
MSTTAVLPTTHWEGKLEHKAGVNRWRAGTQPLSGRDGVKSGNVVLNLSFTADDPTASSASISCCSSEVGSSPIKALV